MRKAWRWPTFLTVLAMLAGATWAYVDPGQPDEPVQRALEAQDLNYQAGGGGCRRQGAERPAEDDAAAEHDSCTEAAEEHRLKQNDLVQQTRSADAAESMARLTHIQTRSLALATLIGLLTLAAASVAAYFAREAARHTEAGAAIAQKTLDAAHRPHLLPDKVTMQIAPHISNRDGSRVHLVLRNFGSEPAWITGYGAWVQVRPIGAGPDWNLGSENIAEGMLPVPPDRTWLDPRRFDPIYALPGDSLASALLGEIEVFFIGFVEYLDAQGMSHAHRFVYQYAPDEDDLRPYPSNLWFYDKR